MSATKRKWSMSLTAEDEGWIADIREAIGILHPRRQPPDDAKIVRAALESAAAFYKGKAREHLENLRDADIERGG